MTSAPSTRRTMHNRRRWIIRHRSGGRMPSMVLGTVVTLLLAAMTVAMGNNASGSWSAAYVLWLVPLWMLVGVMANIIANQGARLGDNELILEASLGRATIPLREVDEVHLGRDRLYVSVKTGAGYVYQSISLYHRAGERGLVIAGVDDMLREAGLHVQWVDSREDAKLQPRRFAAFHGPAVLATLVRPWVLAMTLLGIALFELGAAGTR
ncbi:hypothetical protein QQX09_07225 [Demequina sp. SYSU T00192]|uniref:PH domain-containing protein n=1 Tax=Demequina litoralis TaxID=3051660 RepID=A0ABT8G9H2_9MICO|nr:hypothetical protein [Demequina sp. SYSU T00192]MDN4475642.1 hypothetical protein [Demequina sp. SYSU T00192]